MAYGVSVKLNGTGLAPFTALATGVMLSSESLTLLGNSVGVTGIFFLFFIPAAITLHIFTALSFGESLSSFHGQGTEGRFIRKAMGPLAAIVFPIGARVPFTVCAATGILATAGYVFNETFLYWFPNLGFSFCLLGLLLLINLIGRTFSERAQIFFVTVTLCGLLLLSAVGFSLWGDAPSVSGPAEFSSFHIARAAFMAPVLFVGFDLAAMNTERSGAPAFVISSAMVGGLIVVGFVFCVWGVLSQKYVPLTKLADTTIPYTIAARAIMGQTGRVWMGIVILSGTCAAVNALLLAVSRMIAGLSAQGLLPSFLGATRNRAPVPLVLLGLGIGAMMAFGMAGEPVLEVYTRAGLCLWILYYAVIHLCVLIVGRCSPERSKNLHMQRHKVFPAIALFLFIIILSGMLWTDSDSIFLMKSILVMVAGLSIYGLLWLRFGRTQTNCFN